jgi:4-diphosphocytidyl-2C-methyl-D-erythritol kinase
MVSGSGPTVFGLFDDVEAARAAAAALVARHPGTVAAEPAGAGFAEVRSA